jgi:hypothetical protein
LPTCSVVTCSPPSHHLCQSLRCVPSPFPHMPIVDDWGATWFHNNLRPVMWDFGSLWTIISKSKTDGNLSLQLCVANTSHATQVILILTCTHPSLSGDLLPGYCSDSTHSWTEERSRGPCIVSWWQAGRCSVTDFQFNIPSLSGPSVP